MTPSPPVRGSDGADARTAVRDTLVMAHIGLVKAMAHRIAKRLPPQVERADLVSAGTMGLIEAATRYRASTGVPFDAFARRRVQGAMLDALRHLDWAPRSLRKLERDLDAALARLRQDLRREPTDADMAGAMRLTEDDYRAALERVRALDLGAHWPLNGAASDGVPVSERCLDPNSDPEALMHHSELLALLGRAVDALLDRERRVLALYYEEELTMAEIGQIIGVCESRVSQLRSAALLRLRTGLCTLLCLPHADVQRGRPGDVAWTGVSRPPSPLHGDVRRPLIVAAPRRRPVAPPPRSRVA